MGEKKYVFIKSQLNFTHFAPTDTPMDTQINKFVMIFRSIFVIHIFSSCMYAMDRKDDSVIITFPQRIYYLMRSGRDEGKARTDKKEVNVIRVLFGVNIFEMCVSSRDFSLRYI